jgi:glycerol 3-phosphatase-2
VERLTGIDTVLLDLDGTLYVGSQVVPGASEAVRWLRAQGLTVRFTTNTDSIPPARLPTASPGSASRPPRTS